MAGGGWKGQMRANYQSWLLSLDFFRLIFFSRAEQGWQNSF
jgi:hypothetical protein